MRQEVLVLSAVVGVVALVGRAAASDYDIVINEIAYNPASGDNRDEFVELYNRGPAAVDLAGWRFSEGISLVLPSLILKPGEYLVVSPDAEHARLRYRITNVVGNFTGRLDNDGEPLALQNAQGQLINRLHYTDGDPWPSHPDGLGPTLELGTPHEVNDLPQKWASSLTLDGTPGRRNTRFRELESAVTVVAADDVFQTFKGRSEPSSPLTRWTERGFTPGAAWQTLQGPFGYGEYPYNTELTDMEADYTTFYVRKVFDMDAESLSRLRSGSLGMNLRVDYDDAFVAFLNGQEIGRINVGNPGQPVPFNSLSDDRGDGTVTLSLTGAGALLAQTGNVLAILGVNTEPSSDFYVSPELILSSVAQGMEEVKPQVVINEVRPSEAGVRGFIEIYNDSSAPVDVGGWFIVDTRGSRFEIPAGTTLEPGAIAAFGDEVLGFLPSLSGPAYALTLHDGTWADGIDPRTPPPGRSGLSFGRVRDGGEDQYLLPSPSRGTANSVVLPAHVVINEILYHPPFVAPSGECFRQCSDRDQWIELHNQSASPAAVGGWSLTKAVDFIVPADTTIPAGGYLVIAADRAAFLARHPAVPPAMVVGGWTRSLGRDTDTINLRDELENRVDHVKYGDGSPINDEQPIDGVDDRTLRASEWPRGADEGQGRTLELIHAGLDNRAATAWAVGPVGGTPGAQNTSHDTTPLPAVWDVENEPVLPAPGAGVKVTCRVSSLSPLAVVQAQWRLEPAGAWTPVDLRDDGLSGDETAGDSEYTGSLPGQAAGRVVAYRIQVQAQDGQTRQLPLSPPSAPYPGFQGPYFLYLVGGSSASSNGSPTYHVVMAEADRAELLSRPVTSNVLLPCTFIADGKAFHHVGIRIRGESTRSDARKPWKIYLPPETKFRGLENLNLVSHDIHHELLAADLFRRAGLPCMQEWSVNLVFQGALDPLYAVKENMDGEFLERLFGGSSGGNLYRAIDPLPAGGQPQGDLTYYGEDPADLLVYREVYEKRSNKEEDDYSDIIALCRAFDDTATSDAAFPDLIESLIDVEQWARFFAVQACLANDDGGIQNSTGEDYLLYKVPESSPRPDHGKWLLVPWDVDETFEDSDERLFRPTIPGIVRFLTHPRYAPRYYAHLLDLRDGAFARFETRQRFFLIDDLFGFTTIDGLDTYITERIGFIDERIPVGLSVGVSTAAGEDLIPLGDMWKYFEGRSEPSGGNRSWASRTFNDASWSEGRTGIGYNDPDLLTELVGMEDQYTTVYARKTFRVADPAFLGPLRLSIRYDDGFVAYLNGQEVARQLAPGPANSFVPFDETATALHEAGSTPLVIDLTAFQGVLVPGDNVLAIQALNDNLGSSDLSLIPRLFTSQSASQGAGCGEVLYATGAAIGLTGRSHAAFTDRVEVNGAAASYDRFTAQWSGQATLGPGVNTVRVEAFDAAGMSLEVLQVTVHRLAKPFNPVGGTLAASTVWTAAAGPYLMNSDVVVPLGTRLTIEPGTVVLGQAATSLIVRGDLQAVGTQAAPIIFRAFSCANRMGGIALDRTGTGAAAPVHRLRFCDIEFGQNPAGFAGTVAPVQAKLLVEDCIFRELTANAIDGTDARVEVRRSLFEKIHEGVHCTRSVVIVEDCTFSGMIGDKDAIDFDLNGPGGERSRIERCLIENSSDDGIDLQATTVDIRDNIIRFVQDKAISLEENGPVGGPTVVGNLIHDSGTAIAVKNGVILAEAHHNTVVGNQEGVNLFAKAGAPDGGHGSFHSMIIWNNIYDVKVDARSTVSFTHSDIGDLWPGAGNINTDPRFADELERNFSLTPASPAVRAGMNGTDMGALPFSTPVVFVRGDGNSDGQVEIADVVLGLNVLFRDQAPPSCLDRLDANDDGFADISDPVYLIFYLYGGGPAPRLPFPTPNTDPTEDTLTCQ